MTESLDLAGIGIGPFNLSLAAQLDSIAGPEVRFFDRKPQFAWHPGMMLPGVELQTSFLKDLVMATNPTSPWSFIAYLVAHKRFYEFLNADFEAVPRREFARYLAWVAENLPTLHFGREVREVSFDGEFFKLSFDSEERLARNLSLGVGLAPHIPAWAEPVMGDRAFHSSEAAYILDNIEGRRIMVVGGGQSGAEIVLNLLLNAPAGTEISWISRRPNFQPLDDTPFTNELFTPNYVERFHALAEPRRRATVAHQKLAGDGISTSTLCAIYRRLYELRHLSVEGPQTNLLPHREVLDLAQEGDEMRFVMRNGFDGGIETLDADALVLATGYSFALPECLSPLGERLALDENGLPRLAADFSIQWDGPADCRIFALNAGRFSHGIAEPQLSLMAWRSAMIVNALMGQRHFDLEHPAHFMYWTGEDNRAQPAGASALRA
ncbi:lysine N(6)-hydroxylase/L-ornithine N(5)-oxygenase family protein [Chelativorans sp. YIM 93263]|uniref:lysine N(6)-hydroxylase/L-ornithine N(5)-oxygenase family protein n=1 Tax=Chelativorans sp. YIM 93263 TaxID=2906648 RepID=UPI002379E9FB|nr:SidA/IucD/PvdA family monooxygenase [Chelativorans sp. YIM 93263]